MGKETTRLRANQEAVAFNCQLRAASDTVSRTMIQAEVMKLRNVLKIVATGIKRDKKRNATWLHGNAAIVHLIQETLKR